VAAGIDRRDVYVTNAVKHFKWKARVGGPGTGPGHGAAPGGGRRLHETPSARERAACFPWLEAEIAAIRPDVLVCLGATAAQAVLGREFRVNRMRGRWVHSPLAPRVIATVHPSAILRAPDDEARHAGMARFVDDLRVVAREIATREERLFP